MHPNDVKVARLTRNLMSMSESAASFSVAEAERSRHRLADARKAAMTVIEAPPKTRKRGRAAVVSWDLGHNPAGRAYVLYQLLKKEWTVDLIGPMWSRYGSQLWAPLRDSDLRVRSFHCNDVSDFVPKAEAIAAGQQYDIVYVCKPRLPSLYLGALIKEASQCSMVLDVDDFELSFFKDESYATLEELQVHVDEALHEPFEQLGTRYAQTLVKHADSVTVSNVALRKRFGGHIVRHARDEKQFANSPERRATARERLGISKTDFALIFIGTPRPHKGVLDVAKALNDLKDPDLVFHIVGSIGDASLKKAFDGFPSARVVFHPNCAFDDLPDLLAGADLVPLIQDSDHSISQYQIPAKVSDALALGVSVLATRTPPLIDLIASGAIEETDKAQLASRIAELKQSILAARSVGLHEAGNQQRRNFVSELGMSVNRTRLDLAIKEARDCQVARQESSESTETFFSRRAGDKTQLVHESPWLELISLFRNHYRTIRSRQREAIKVGRGESVTSAKPNTVVARIIEYTPALIKSRSASYDVAFFWKQNDSNLYGRRADMIASGLANSGRIGKMIHWDTPVSIPSLKVHFENKQREVNGQQELILKNLVDRQLGVFDTEVVRNRTHVFSGQPNPAQLLGKPVGTKGSYVRYVNEQLEEHGMRASNTLAWFCPVIWEAPELIEKIGFAGVIADLIDDQRGWDCTADFRKKLEANYSGVLGAADLVFANCDSLAEAMQQYVHDKIHVVPNGAERFDRFPDSPIPARLKNISGPIAGYVGNLRDRIDWTLLHDVVRAMPDVSFVFFGPSSDNPNANSLALHSNVHVLGVVPYDELAFHLKSFDVGLVPHLDNELTARMNPLKVYNYFAAGLPIVSSEVSNLASLGDSLKTASTSAEFIQAIRDSLAMQIDTGSAQWQSSMNAIAWETRVNSMLEIMDQNLHRKLRKSA